MRSWRVIHSGRPEPPPATARGFLPRARELVIIKHRPHVLRRRLGKRIAFEQRGNVWRALQQLMQKRFEPWLIRRGSERGEPHLKVKPRLMWNSPEWRPVQR